MNVDEVIARSKSQIGKGIRYKNGAGTFRAGAPGSADSSNRCDCSAFVCWALGVDKCGDYPYLRSHGEPRVGEGEWYGTDNIVNDAVHLNVGIFDKTNEPAVGGIVVYPTRWKNGKASPSGHCGIITELKANGTIAKVIHCSNGNDKAKKDAVQETSSAVFDLKPRTIFVWCARIETPKKLAAVAAALVRPVRFCVVAPGATGTNVASVARPIAALNPIGREVVVRGDPSYPPATQIAAWTAGVASPGAVVLKPDGSLMRVLNEQRAANPAHIESAFVDGATS